MDEGIPVPRTAPLDTSIALAELASTRARLGAMVLDDPRRPMPLVYTPPGGSIAGTSAGTAPSADPARGAATAGTGGPIGRSLRDLSDGTLTVRQLIEDSLKAVARRDPALNAIATLLADDALADAERLDRELRDGHPLRPLHGIPITVKDVIDVGGVETRCGSDAYLDLPAVDAAGVPG